MIISGKELAKEIKEHIARKVASYKVEYGREPHLSVILVGDDPSSHQYVRSKGRYAGEVGFTHEEIILPESITETELIAKVEELNNNPGVDGILVQLPLPKHIRKHRVIEAIDPGKDVDGFQSKNVDALWHKLPGTRACTPKGILKLLDKANVEIAGKHAVVIGRSNIVGFPVAKLLLDRNATVTIAHRHTRDLAEITRQADILVVAIGQPRLITGDMVKDGVAVIDVGITRDVESGKYFGDVDFETVSPKASVITPVPGGVGPMTIACLMENTLDAYVKHMES
ncbi:MAG: bifunctional 5,10-methylenetetrahydrofolate dehydrogenase/5,10-methenyltetrahydrofolate cyclohydrolase [Muribaculaceae bacterium]|nr:bifunctional 5,10-methylenetetrahydrofolate dehydrogenase/5,10-methenyltetrahydrofolate cyclohydrolase [Muribaculaceae bacterium]